MCEFVRNLCQRWQKQSNFEKSLSIIFVLSLSGLIAVLISHSFTAAVADDVCLTPGCMRAASRILRQMNKTMDPCDDFYNFACGNFMRITKIPDGRLEVNSFWENIDIVHDQLHAVLSEEVDPNDSAPFNMIKTLYKTCMNTTLIEGRGLDPMITIMDQLGGWPVIKGDKWDTESKWRWTRAVGEFHKLGYSTDQIISFSVANDVKNATARIIYIDQAKLDLTPELIGRLNNSFDDYYHQTMVNISVLYGADRSLAEKELMESFEFEKELAKISLSKEKQRNVTALYNSFTLKQVQEKYPYIDWVDYINALLPPPLSVDENEVVVVLAPSYLEKLGQLLRNTPNRTIANYMMWRIIQFSSPFLTDDISKLTNGGAVHGARWKECVGIISGNHINEKIQIISEAISIAAGALYVRKYFRPDSKAAAVEMVNAIRKDLERSLDIAIWMDDETRSSAINKLKVMAMHIGYPDELMDDEKIQDFYKNLDINGNSYLEFVLSITKFRANYVFGLLRKPVNKTDWIDHAQSTVVNAFYAPFENSISIPAAILQGNHFSADRPRYMNFGTIGTTVGHEIIHGFDDVGSQFDLNGNLRNWWMKPTEERYLQKVDCIIKQYGNYTESSTGLKLNGVLTQGENIADNGGIKLSYHAYQQWVEENAPEPKLPGLTYTTQQLFWISAAQNWCSVARLVHIKILNEVHSPDQFRVLGPFSNRMEFATDFNCPIGSPMNPTKKCEVW